MGAYVHLDPFLKGGRRCPIYVTYCTYTVYVVVDKYQRRAHWIECIKCEKEMGGGVQYIQFIMWKLPDALAMDQLKA